MSELSTPSLNGRAARIPGRKKERVRKGSSIREKVYFCAGKQVNFSLALFLFYLMEKMTEFQGLEIR